jgi:exodeoxyribonuclease V beta subunit
MPRGYPERVAALDALPLRGFMTGSIDLVFAHDGRWWLVDHKSNLLGGRLSDYAPGRLARAMADAHYFLQYHLYVVALHRYLAWRLPGYDYDRDFGGVLYLFLRGMAPETRGETGVFRDRPSVRLVQELSDLLDQGAPR